MNNNNNPLGDFGDKAFEQLENVKNTAVRETKSFPKMVKKQVVGTDQDQTMDKGKGMQEKKQDKGGGKFDPVTGKPIPSQQMVATLSAQTAQLARMRMKKVREELEKQRLKVTDEKQKLAPVEAAKAAGMGPVVPAEGAETEKKPKSEAVAATLKGSKSTGEFKGLIGG